MLNLYFDSDSKTHKSFELPGARPHYTPDRPGQVEHIFLDLVLDIPHETCTGTCTIQLNPVRSGITQLTLDAVELEIKSVKVGKTKQHFDYDGEQLQIFLAEPSQIGNPIQLIITYTVQNPRRGLYFIKPDKHYPDKPLQVWTQGEDEDSRFWFPCFDYPGQLSTSEIRVKVPANLLAISNGELINTDTTPDDHKVYHWLQKQVHPTYLITLAVGEFAETQDQWQQRDETGEVIRTVPVTYYVEKARAEDAQRTMGKTPEMIEFFSQTFGYPYPYPKYAQVCVADYIFGGMENTSTTLLTDRCLLDEKAVQDHPFAEMLVAHELAHQWFGDLVVIKHWSHAWLKEGMASYAEVLWTDHEYGADDAAYYRLNEARNYLTEDSSRYRRPIVTHIYREAIELYDRHLYEKGACVYHMIRAELGDELFFQAIQTFVNNHAHSTVETVDLLRAIEQATGRNLLFLFDQYVYRGGHPEYKIAYAWDGDSNLAKLTVTQTQVKADQKDAHKHLFDLKIPIVFGYVTGEPEETSPKSGKKSKKNKEESEPSENPGEVRLQSFSIRVHEREQAFYFPLEAKPAFISFDAGNHYLKTVTLEYPVAELKAQLKYDPDPLSRIYAAQALAKKGGLEVVKALAEALKQDAFWGVRAEVAKQLAEVKLDQVFDALVVGLQDPEPRVRRTVVGVLAKIKTQESYKALKPFVEKGDSSYSVEAAAASAIGEIARGSVDDKPTQEQVIKLLKSVLKERQGWNEVVRSGAIAGLSKLTTSEDALDLILKYTVPGVPQPLRLAAIRALGAVSTGQKKANLERILQHLSQLAQETFFLTQMSVVTALSQMETAKAIRVLQSIADQTPDGRVRRRAEEAIQKVQKTTGTDKAIKQLREELDQVKKDNQELRSRLEQLEAKKN